MSDPRVLRSRTAVLQAAVDLVVDGGPTALTVDAVVARSGVAKSTIYRHWPTRDDLLVGVFDYCAPRLPRPAPELAFADGVRRYVHDVLHHLIDPKWARMMPALLALKAHEHGLATVENELEAREQATMRDLLARGVREGAVRLDVDPSEAIAHLVGPLVFALLTNAVRLDEGFADRTVDAFLTAYAPAPAARVRSR